MLGGASEKRAAPVCIIPKDKLLAWKLNPITYAWPLLHSQVQKSSFRLPPRNARRRYKNFSVCLESESHVCVIHFSQMENKAATGAAFFRPPAHSSLNSQQAGWVKQITGAGARKSSRARLPPLFEPAVPVELLKERRPDAHIHCFAFDGPQCQMLSIIYSAGTTEIRFHSSKWVQSRFAQLGFAVFCTPDSCWCTAVA